MKLNEYQNEAIPFDRHPEESRLLQLTVGMCSEAGEVAGKIHKRYRDNEGKFTGEAVCNIESELGDVLWYISAIALELGLTLDHVALYNLAKLADRKVRGKLSGSGDNR